MKEKSWTSHLEFLVILTTLIGGFYTLDTKIERNDNRIDQTYCMWAQTQQEIKQQHIDFHKELRDIYKNGRQ